MRKRSTTSTPLVALARGRHERVVSVGASMGAFVALRHAGLGGHVDAVIAISSPGLRLGAEAAAAPACSVTSCGPAGVAGCSSGAARACAPSLKVTTPPIEVDPALAAVPVAIVHGDRDRYVPLSDAEALHDTLPGPPRLVVLPGFGHGEAGFGPGFAEVVERLVRELLAQAPELPPTHAS